MMKESLVLYLRWFAGILLSVALLSFLSGCVTTTEVNEGYGVTMEEEKPPSDQVQVYD